MSAAASATQLAALRKYAEPFASRRPPIFDFFPGGLRAVFPFGVDSDRGLGVFLLYASLYRPGGEGRAAETVGGLFDRLGLDIFKLNRIPFPALQKAMPILSGRVDPEEQRRVPGILRSVCDLFYRIGPLEKWLAGTPDWEDCARELSGRIFWMGKTSRLRIKARYFLWLCSFQTGFGRRYPGAADFAWPVLAGHSRFRHHVWRPRSRIPSSPEARLRWFALLGKEAFPGESWKIFQPLAGYLSPDPEHEYFCRRVQGGCRPCPLCKTCPAAPFLIPTEPGV